jgi:AcrR family transcriptional regulator
VTLKKKDNPQKEFSRASLAKALLALMEIKPFPKITVTEITERAQLTRRTFYRHFITQDDLLNYVIQEKANDFLTYLIRQGRLNLSSLLHSYISYWQNHKEFLQLLRKNNLIHILFEKTFPQVNKQYALEFYSTMLQSSDNEIDSDVFGVMFSFVIGGILWALMAKWLDEDGEFSMEETVALVESYWMF